MNIKEFALKKEDEDIKIIQKKLKLIPNGFVVNLEILNQMGLITSGVTSK